MRGLLSAKYVITLGTSAGSDDIVPYTRLSYDVTSQCVDGLHLQHKAVYFVSVTAVNGGLVERNVTVNSDGGRVQLYVLTSINVSRSNGLVNKCSRV